MNGRLTGADSALALLRTEVDDSAAITALSLKGVLSVALISRYRFHELTLLNQKYVLATPFESFTVGRLVADFATIEAKTDNRVIAMVPGLSAYFRKALIAHQVPFLLAGKQAFLPFAYLNLTASKPRIRRSTFAPATQLVFLSLLYGDGRARRQEDLAVQLSLSAMSVSRAVEHLVSHELVAVHTGGKTGRRKDLQVENLADYYRLGMPHFGNPVKQSLHFAGSVPDGLPYSGVDALSRRTLLGPPQRPAYATSLRRRSEIVGDQIDWREAHDRKDSFRVDLLTYDPSVLATDGPVDPVTMLATLGERDERIDQAVQDYLKGFPWYSD